MGRRTGYQCDGPDCKGFVESANIPQGWLILLPHHEDGKPKSETDQLTFCSNRCVAIKAVERAVEVDGLNMRIVKNPRGPRTTNLRSTTDPALRIWLEQNGVGGRSIGGMIGAHTKRHTNEGKVNGDCLVCIYEKAHVDEPVSASE